MAAMPGEVDQSGTFWLNSNQAQRLKPDKLPANGY
jgi:hypothetical protein